MTDFQNKHLREEWEKRQRAILAASSKRLAEDEAARQQLDAELALFRAKNAEVQGKLDQQIDASASRFADLQVELKFDCERLDRSLAAAGGNGSAQTGEGNQCLDARANLAACLRQAEDVRKCDGFVEVMEACIKKQVLSQ